MGTEELDREREGEGQEREKVAPQCWVLTVETPKTCLRWPKTGLSRTGPLVGGVWQWRQQAAVGPFPRWLFYPLASLYVESHRGKTLRSPAVKTPHFKTTCTSHNITLKQNH